MSNTQSGPRTGAAAHRLAVAAVVIGLSLPIGATPAAGVVSGTRVSPEDFANEWSFTVAIGNQSGTWCGGSLIGAEWVLTAGHCANSTITRVFYGSPALGAQASVGASLHAEYPSWWSTFDMALVRLDAPIETLEPVAISSATPLPGEQTEIAGWGATNQAGTQYGTDLRAAPMTVLQETSTFFILAGGFADACYGDSGGPMVDGAGNLVGVTSQAIPTASAPCGGGGFWTDLTQPTVRAWLESHVPDLVVSEPVPVDLQGPAVAIIQLNPEIASIGSSVEVLAVADDAASGASVVASAAVSVAGVTMAMTPVDGTLDTATEQVLAVVEPAAAGLWEVCASATDGAGNVSEMACAPLVVYDPSGGFAAGAGIFESPAGAYIAQPDAAGPAQLAFHARYRPGAQAPDGYARLKFRAGDLVAEAEGVDWLVVTVGGALIKADVLVNGVPGFKLHLTVEDGDTGDRLRVKITDQAGSATYDTSVEGGPVLIPLSAGKVAVQRQ